MRMPSVNSQEVPDTACQPNTPAVDLLPGEFVIEEAARLLKGLSDPTRLRILCMLRGQEVCVHELVEALEVTQSAVSHQLRVLRGARLVARRKDGRHAYYRLADEHVEEMLANALSHGEEATS